MFFNAGMVGITFVHMFDPSHGTHGVKSSRNDFLALSLASLAAVDGELGDDEDGKKWALELNLTESSVWECQHVTRCVNEPAG